MNLQDENRYSVSRGAFRNLKRAERARVTVNKIPGKATLSNPKRLLRGKNIKRRKIKVIKRELVGQLRLT